MNKKKLVAFAVLACGLGVLKYTMFASQEKSVQEVNSVELLARRLSFMFLFMYQYGGNYGSEFVKHELNAMNPQMANQIISDLKQFNTDRLISESLKFLGKMDPERRRTTSAILDEMHTDLMGNMEGFQKARNATTTPIS